MFDPVNEVQWRRDTSSPYLKPLTCYLCHGVPEFTLGHRNTESIRWDCGRLVFRTVEKEFFVLGILCVMFIIKILQYRGPDTLKNHIDCRRQYMT